MNACLTLCSQSLHAVVLSLFLLPRCCSDCDKILVTITIGCFSTIYLGYRFHFTDHLSSSHRYNIDNDEEYSFLVRNAAVIGSVSSRYCLAQ